MQHVLGIGPIMLKYAPTRMHKSLPIPLEKKTPPTLQKTKTANKKQGYQGTLVTGTVTAFCGSTVPKPRNKNAALAAAKQQTVERQQTLGLLRAKATNAYEVNKHEYAHVKPDKYIYVYIHAHDRWHEVSSTVYNSLQPCQPCFNGNPG